MLTLKEWMELADYRITEGSDYFCDRYGHDVYALDSWNGEQDGYSFTVIFDTRTQAVYEVQAHDYTHNRAYRMIAQGYEPKDSKDNEAWDDVNYVDLEVDDDFIQKCLAIKDGEDYDTRVKIPLVLPDDQLFELMKLAHEQDITFNCFVENLLREEINRHKNDDDLLRDLEEIRKDYNFDDDDLPDIKILADKIKSKKKKKKKND